MRYRTISSFSPSPASFRRTYSSAGSGLLSRIGMFSGSPYVAAVEEKTIFFTPYWVIFSSEHKRAVYVVVIIFARILHTLADKRIRCKMNDRINIVFSEIRYPETLPSRRSPTYSLPPSIASLWPCCRLSTMTISSPRSTQRSYRMRANIACSSSY